LPNTNLAIAADVRHCEPPTLERPEPNIDPKVEGSGPESKAHTGHCRTPHLLRRYCSTSEFR
jgi:hypothetical protein